MTFEKLSENDKQIVVQCLNAILNSNFLEHEFHARLGLEQEDLARVVSACPNIDDLDEGFRNYRNRERRSSHNKYSNFL
ncbi:MAG: hypothetical protein WKF90_10375 [Pyrinomonadaceae bacterium]